MARYQIPPDPRKGTDDAPHAQKVAGRAPRSSPPWLWIGLGAIVTLLAIAVAVLWARLFLDVQPPQSQPTLPPVINTATPTSVAPALTPTAALHEPAPAAAPAESPRAPQVTAMPSAAPMGTIVIGGVVTVVNTGVGLNLRSEPVVDPGNILALVPDGTVLEVMGGPQEAEGFTWWRLVTPDGTEGWAVQDFLDAS